MREERKCQDGILKMLVTIPLELLNHLPRGLLAYLLLSQHLIILHPLYIHRRSQTLNPQHHTLFLQVREGGDLKNQL